MKKNMFGDPILQPGDDIGAEVVRRRCEIEDVDLTGLTAHRRSRASRIPVNCHRFSG